MNVRRLLVSAATVLVVATLAVLGAVLPAPSGDPPGAPPAGPAAAGGAICPLGDTEAGAALDIVLAAPDASAVSAAAARATVVALGARPGRSAPAPLAPGGVVAVPVDVAAGGSTWVGWADAPVVALRTWRRPAAPGVPRGRADAVCVPAEATTWHIVGLRTDGGSEARIRLANPFGVDATVAVTLTTIEGAVAPLALQNLSVPARGTADVRVNDHVPERADVAALVRVTSGRAAAEGLQLAVAGIGGVDGTTLVPAATAAARDWTLPWVPGGDGAWIWVLNPSERDVELEITVHTVDGPGLPPGAETVGVPAGRLVRVAAAELVPAGVAAVGVSLRSPTDPVVVGGGWRIDPGDPAGSGIAALPAVPDDDQRWLLQGRADADRTETLRLVAVGGDDVTATVLLRTGEATDRTLATVEVPAGGRRDVVVPVAAGLAWAVEVVADGPVVVARTAVSVGTPDPVVVAGVPASAWEAAASGPGGRRADGWSLRAPVVTDQGS